MNKGAACRFILGLSAISIIASAAYSQSPTPKPNPVNFASAKLGAVQAAVADTLAYLKRLEKLGFAGVVLVAKEDAPLLAEGFGQADRERKIRWAPGIVSSIGSITKQFTGAAILKLEEEKKLCVTDPITRYFEDVPPGLAGITLHQLLTHSSGLSDPDIGDFDAVPLNKFLREVFARPLAFAPGTGYLYSNANFSLLGAIIEKLSGMSYEAFLRTRFFLPNGMYETGYTLPEWGEDRIAKGYEEGGKSWGTILQRVVAAGGPPWALRANGGLHTTAYDMLRWAHALLGGRALTPESMKKLWTPHVNEGGETFYGYGWSIAKAPDGTKVVTHNGGNGIYFADLALVPDAGWIIFVMTNVIAEDRSAASLVEQIGMRFMAGQRYPEIPEAVDMSAADLSGFAGTYLLGKDADALRVSVQGNALFIEAKGRKAFSILNSVREFEQGSLDELSGLMEAIIAGNMKGDFTLLFKAYGERVPLDRLKTRWAEQLAENEKILGRFRRYEVLGTARTLERNETVVRLFCEKGTVDLTYTWDPEQKGRLLGRSMPGLKVRMRLFPSSEHDFFTWDGGVRPPNVLHIEADADGKLNLKLGTSLGIKPQQSRKSAVPPK